jgi:hypothetical protein
VADVIDAAGRPRLRHPVVCAHLQAISTKVRGCLPSDAGFTHRDRAREKDRTELRLDEFEADVRD